MSYTVFGSLRTSFCFSNGTPASANCFLALARASAIFCSSVLPSASFVFSSVGTGAGASSA